MRVPTLARWPGRVEKGTTSFSVMSQLDFLPTFAALAGVTLSPTEVGDGVNILPQVWFRYEEV